jgi:hypothetical protein
MTRPRYFDVNVNAVEQGTRYALLYLITAVELQDLSAEP